MIKYKIQPCPRCGGAGMLYAEGMAKSIFDGEWNMFFTDFDGYVVQCEDCEKVTLHHVDPSDAVREWNNKGPCFEIKK